MDDQRWWLSGPISVNISDQGKEVRSPSGGAPLRVTEAVLNLLGRATEGIGLSDVIQATGRAESEVNQLLQFLVDEGYLVQSRDLVQKRTEPWTYWGDVAFTYHRDLLNSTFTEGVAAEELTAAQRDDSRPSSFSEVTNRDDVILLPRGFRLPSADFVEVFISRRTTRRFSGNATDLDAFSSLLWLCLSPMRFIDAGELGVLGLRTAASAGGRMSHDAYVLVVNVAGVQAGTYEYDPLRHGIVLVRDGDPSPMLDDLLYGQSFAEGAGFAIFLVARPMRLAWKYRHPIAYKLIWQDAGHLSQSISVCANYVGLSCAMTGAIRFSMAQEMLALQDPDFSTFALILGEATHELPATTSLAPAVAPEYY